jgi:hypothetical protein
MVAQAGRLKSGTCFQAADISREELIAHWRCRRERALGKARLLHGTCAFGIADIEQTQIWVSVIARRTR